MINVGIIGYGVIGQAVDSVFDKNKVATVIYDTETHRDSWDSIVETDFVFICIPTEKDAGDLANATIDDTAIEQLLLDLEDCKYKGIVIVKSTLPIEFDNSCGLYNLKIVVNPEFLTERNAKRDMVDSNQIILGADDPSLIAPVTELYNCTFIRKRWIFPMTIVEAIMYKLFTNVFLASKVALFNQFNEIFTQHIPRGLWDNFVHVFKHDPRIGSTHMDVPGWDGKKGFGGKCFPACVNYLNQISSLHDGNSNIINAVVEKNKATR